MNRGQRMRRGGFRGGGGGGRSYRGHGPFWREGNFRGGGGNNRFFNNPRMLSGNRNQSWHKNKTNTPGKRLSEDQIGVTEYISDHPGFSGIIKNRFSDFQVSEINEAGEIAKLTDTTPPVLETEVVDEDEDFLLSKYNLEILPMETWDEINTLVVNNTTSVVQVDVTGMSKDQRTKIHEAVKKAFGDAVVGSTVAEEDKKFVKFQRYRVGVRVDKRVKWMWPGEYVHFVVYKENCDTMEAATLVATRLNMYHIKPSMVGYAGSKDRRGKTSQWFSLRKIDPSKIAKACEDLRDIKAGNYRFADNPLKLGCLKGNRFRIALRNVTADDSIVDKACQDLRDKGFINYYGLQRFGTRHNTPTYTIGLHLLQGKFQDALNAILEVRDGPLFDALCRYKETGDAHSALRYLRKCDFSTTEGRILKALAAAPKDLYGAMSGVARNVRLLYLHSYQSLVWNRCVSERLRRHTYTPVAGDLVLADNKDYTLENEEAQSESDEEPTEPTETPEDKETEAEPKEEQPKEEKPRIKVPVKVLTESDIASGKYSMFDIIMPLPGFDVEYPTNMKDYYEELLTKDNLKLKLRHKYRSYSLSGAYRHMVARPVNMEWSCVRYSDPFGDLIASDADELLQKKPNGIEPDGKFKALLVTLTLSSSCYATMALREILKSNTSGDYQASLNNYFKTADSEEGEKVEKRKIADDEEVASKKIKEDEEVLTEML